MMLPFLKLEGLGNNYIFVELKKVHKNNLPRLARAVSNEKTGIGADGLIVVDTDREPFLMRTFNSDGSEAEICGNGIRQAALFLRQMKYPRRRKFMIKTCADIYAVNVKQAKGNIGMVHTSLGKPDFSAEAVGVKSDTKLAFDIPFMHYGERAITLDCVSMGNPHAVVFVSSYDFDWPSLGKTLSESEMFKHGANINFMKVVNKSKFEVKTYERGTGVTSACGSGAAACMAVGVMRDILKRDATAVLSGGKLSLNWQFENEAIFQTGPASVVCRGEYFV
jgi:diaminopimelate epimerase